jgi:cytochrome c peroxidase
MRPGLLLIAILSAAHAGKLPVPLGLDAYLPAPADNPLTREKVNLGRDLFNDKRLSRDRSVSCATCHDPTRAFTDGKPVASGIDGRKGQRRSPTLINRAYGRAFFWDGRALTLEDQVVQPILHRDEMDMTIPAVLDRLRESPSYEDRFVTAFQQPLSEATLRKALASHVRSILSGGSPYDRYVGGDKSALSEQAQLGLRIFRGKANCASCHVGPNLSDEQFHNTGIAWSGRQWKDVGRAQWSRNPDDRGAFKTPTLREVARTGPYFHDGSSTTLEAVIDYYDQGGRPNPGLDAEIRPLRLSDSEKAALLAFLQSLTGVVQEGWN